MDNTSIPPPSPVLGKRELDQPIPAYGSFMGPFDLPTAQLETLPAPASGGQTYLPFGIINSSTTTTPQITVLSGFVGESMNADSSITITNIDTPITVSSNSLIFLKGDVTSLSTTALTVTVSSTWTGYPALIHLDSGPPIVQDEYYVLIGYVGSTPADPDNTPGFPITISSSDYWVYQRLRTDLMEQTICSDGTPCLYPFAFPGPVV